MSRKVSGWILAVAVVVSYNTWVLAFLSPHRHPLAGYVSELAADDQPYSWVFRSGDLTGGILMTLIAGLGVRAWAPRLGRWSWGVAAALGLTGIATIADVAWNLPCSASFDDACFALRQAQPLRPEFLLHTISSTIATSALLASIVMAAIALRGRCRWILIALLLSTIVTSAASSLIDVQWRSGQGYVQIVQIIVVSVWIGCLALATGAGRGGAPDVRTQGRT